MYLTHLRQQLEGYRRQDPTPQPKLAIPITVIHFIITKSYFHTHSKQITISNLCCIAFYFLLQVGEYTTRSVTPHNTTRTIQFRLSDITLWDNQYRPIPHTLPLHILLCCCCWWDDVSGSGVLTHPTIPDRPNI